MKKADVARAALEWLPKSAVPLDRLVQGAGFDPVLQLLSQPFKMENFVEPAHGAFLGAPNELQVLGLYRAPDEFDKLRQLPLSSGL